MRYLFLAIFFLIPFNSFADVYAVYDDTDEIINVIVYDGIAEYDETVFYGAKARKVLLRMTDLGENVSIGDTYENEKFIKKIIEIE